MKENDLEINRKRPRVLVLSGVRGDTRRYRTFHLYEQLQLLGLPATLSHLMDPALLRYAEAADLAVIHRSPYDGRLSRLFEILERRCALVIQDLDDLIFDVQAFQWIDSPDFKDPVRAALYLEDMRRSRQTLDRCPAASVSTGYLAERIRSLGKPAWVHRNAFSLEMLALAEQAYRQSRRSQEKVVIGYASGTPTHNKDFALVKSSLLEVLRRFPQVELHIIGPLDAGQKWGVFRERVRHFPLVPWRDLPAFLAGFDINLAPLLASNPFSQSKSEIKFMEAALVRVPTIASHTDAFAYAIRSGENGLLAETEEQWLNALTMLVEDQPKQLEIGQSAYSTVVRSYHPAARAAELAKILNEISFQLRGRTLWDPIPDEGELRRRAQAFSWSSASAERHPSMAEMAWYNLRQRGVRTLTGQVWVFFRRLAAPLFPYKSR
jgi:glycosyltransferase involved in cell wall biosynthesis